MSHALQQGCSVDIQHTGGEFSVRFPKDYDSLKLDTVLLIGVGSNGESASNIDPSKVSIIIESDLALSLFKGS